MKTAKFGNLEVGKVHRIVATVHMKSDLAKLSELARGNCMDILELRADQLYSEGREVVEDSLREMKQFHLPIIATIREGEKHNLTDKDRLALFKVLIPEVDVIDIELRTSIRDEVTKMSKQEGRAVIISEHNFNTTPPDAELQKILSQSRSCGADVTKIALYPKSPGDVPRLMRFTVKQAEETPLACFSLGDTGAITRIIAPILGSCLSYAYIEKPVAPGQSSVISLNSELTRYLDNLHQP